MDAPEVEGMEHVGWYQPSRELGKHFWPKGLTPNDEWTPPVLPVYVPVPPNAALVGDQNSDGSGAVSG